MSELRVILLKLELIGYLTNKRTASMQAYFFDYIKPKMLIFRLIFAGVPLLSL
jgi:hypothetical protein